MEIPYKMWTFQKDVVCHLKKKRLENSCQETTSKIKGEKVLNLLAITGKNCSRFVIKSHPQIIRLWLSAPDNVSSNFMFYFTQIFKAIQCLDEQTRIISTEPKKTQNLDQTGALKGGGDTFGFFNIHSVTKYQKFEGGPFGDVKNFSKEVSQCRK